MMMDPEPPEPRRTGRERADMLMAGSALFVSFVSLGLAILHGRTMERMAEANARLVQANSWPSIAIYTGNQDPAGKPAIQFELDNAGVGPAKLRWLEMFYNGKPLGGWTDLLKSCCGQDLHGVDAVTSVAEGRVLRAGDSIGMFSLARNDADRALWEKLNRERFGVTYQVCYCSVFDECWRSDGRTLDPARVASCGVPDHPFDEMH